MTSEPRANVADDGRWVEQAVRILAGLGFALMEQDRTKADDTSHLLIALRAEPTLSHFDPERIDFWATENGRGRARVLDRESSYPVAIDFAWGRIGIADRLGVRNEFLSFGGSLRAQPGGDDTILVDFASHAPILRWSGHSQTPDPVASEVGAFFGRLKVPIDFVPGSELLVAQAAPTTLYCAFLQHVRERIVQARTLREANRWLADWSAREAQHAQTNAPDHWKAAQELRTHLSAVEAIARE